MSSTSSSIPSTQRQPSISLKRQPSIPQSPYAAVLNDDNANLWQLLLRGSNTSASSNNNSTHDQHLVVCGKRRSGRHTLISKLKPGSAQQDNHGGQSPRTAQTHPFAKASDSTSTAHRTVPASVLDYTSLTIATKDETIDKLNVWYTEDAQHAQTIVPSLLQPSTASSTTPTYLITVDFSRPWLALPALTEWLQTIKAIQLTINANRPKDTIDAHKLDISRYVQTYRQKHLNTNSTADGSDSQPTSTSKPFDDSSIPIDASIPSHNTGAVIVIVGTKVDAFGTVVNKADADRKFDWLVSQIRRLAIQYGASIVLTSAAPQIGPSAAINHTTAAAAAGTSHTPAPVNTAVLSDYLLHRIYTNTFSHPQASPKVVGNDEDFKLFIPSGYDSIDLIDSTSSVSNEWTAGTDSEIVFPSPSSKSSARLSTGGRATASSKADGKADNIVRATDTQSLFRQMKQHLDTLAAGGSVASLPPLSAITNLSSPSVAANNPARKSGTFTMPVTPASITTPTNSANHAQSSPPRRSIDNNLLTSPTSAVKRSTLDKHGQTAVKNFFAGLLKKPDIKAGASSSDDALRKEASIQLKKMSESQPPADKQ